MAALDYTVERVKKLEAENERLQAQVKEMETKNNTLQAHAQKTTKSNEMLNIEKLNKRVTTLAGANVRLEGRLDEHDMEIEDLQCEVAGMGDSETIERWLLDELDSLKYLIESKEQSLKDEIAKLANKSGEGMRVRRSTYQEPSAAY
jgi:predicted RNase H-like nuclease (RuvC/YqgF family)